MADPRKPYVKIWAAETLLSDDMNSLSDHEERVFFRLMLVASLEETRWITRDTPGLHRKCLTTSPKFARVVARLEALGMVERLSDGRLFVVNGHRWNEQTDRAKAPSDSAEATRERQSRARAAKRHEGVTRRDVSLSRAYIEEEKEEEKEEEIALVTSAPTAALEEPEQSEDDLAVGRLCRSWENATATTVTRTVGDNLADWLERLPEAAIFKAIAETGASNARNWRYCEAILRRYQTEGWADKPSPGRPAARDMTEPPPPTADQVFEWIANRPERYPGGVAQ